MFYGKYKDDNGIERGSLYYSWKDWHADTFSPNCEVLDFIPFTISGKTYKERKESARNLAIDFQLACDTCLYQSEWGVICNFFEKIGKRYGLLDEFKENWIC